MHIIMLLIFAADIPCPPYQHTCDYAVHGDRTGRCVDVFRLCDGVRDCLDQSDESRCRKHSVALELSLLVKFAL